MRLKDLAWVRRAGTWQNGCSRWSVLPVAHFRCTAYCWMRRSEVSVLQAKERRVLVTGASGFVGRFVVDAFVREGWEVVAASRRPLGGSASPQVIPRPLDVADRIAVRKAVRGCSVAVHLAGLAHARGASKEEYTRVNVDGSRIVAEESARVGARRLVIMSSAKVHGGEAGEAFTEDDAPQPVDAYSRSKLRAEEQTERAIRGTGTGAVVLRPPLVYGPGVKANLAALMYAISRGWWVPLARDNRRSLIGVRNLADAVVHATQEEVPLGIFLVSDPVDISTYELGTYLCTGLSTPCRLVAVPRPLQKIARLTAPYLFQRLFASFSIDSSRFRATGWSAPQATGPGLRETAEWYRRITDST
jgi:nucleoside-diphosphate-sugar epimerase